MKMSPTPPIKPSHWMKDAELLQAETAPLRGETTADILIVGGGFVGLWTALTIKEYQPDAHVMVLDQGICGGGASGRNGGFVMSWWPKVGTLRSFCSDDETRFICESSERAISELGEFCERHQIDAHFRQSGWLWTATTPAHIDSWNGTLETCERLGARPFERVDPAEVARRTGSTMHIAGVFERSNATVQPARLVKGMRRVALEQGVDIHENSGVAGIEPGPVVTVTTAGGKVRAKQVVLANNAWAAVLPEIGSMICAVNSSIVATEPMPERLAQIGWDGGESVSDSQLMVAYYRTTHDGRIAFGKGSGGIVYGSRIEGPVFNDDPGSVALTKADFRRNYPQLADVKIAETWSGPIDRTYDSVPVFGRYGDSGNIHFGIGWSGNGVGPSRIGGRILASMALERDDPWGKCSLIGRKARRFPPEPIRYLGGTMVRNAVIRKESAELSGKASSAIDCYLAGFAPSGLEDKS